MYLKQMKLSSLTSGASAPPRSFSPILTLHHLTPHHPLGLSPPLLLHALFHLWPLGRVAAREHLLACTPIACRINDESARVHVEAAGWDAALALWTALEVRDEGVGVCAGEEKGCLGLAGLFHFVDGWGRTWLVWFVGLVLNGVRTVC